MVQVCTVPSTNPHKPYLTCTYERVIVLGLFQSKNVENESFFEYNPKGALWSKNDHFVLNESIWGIVA